ncbi:hypothetical protein PT974_10093 [Cladobotryum mycophilum]|uniref:Uncharacterized protein n=1 Tax=Cladobotryum mycophilum TaxID=491253 RepID=A0ABR0S9S9_9HYPO
MVSFFGLRFGSDKKKLMYRKQSDKKQPPQQQQQTDQNGEGQHGGHNFSRPQRPLSRPGTSNSTTGRHLNWRTAYTDVPAATSMIDLSASRRQPSLGNTGQFPAVPVSRPWMKSNGSTTSLVMPEPFGNHGTRPGTPSRPNGTRKSEWVNPLDVHFCKDPASSTRPGSSSGSNDAKYKSPLGQFQFGAHGDAEGRMTMEMDQDIMDNDNGYPSPPHSIESGELRPSISVTSTNHHNLTISTGFGNGFGPAPLPSPVPSAPRTSEDKGEIPVIRNVKAKRDTLTFLSPRRTSFTMAIEEADKERHRLQQHPVEGLAGNFSEFDFGNHFGGDMVRKTSAAGSLGIELVESPVEMAEPNPFKKDWAMGHGPSESRDTASTGLQPHEQSPRPRTAPMGNTWPQPSGRPETASSNGTTQQYARGPSPVGPRAQPDPDAGLFGRTPPKGFNSRIALETRIRGPLKSLRPLTIATQSPYMDVGAKSPRSELTPGPPADRPPPSPLASKTPMEGDFPVIKGLPRGRLPTRPSIIFTNQQGDESGGLSLPVWDFNRVEARHSAMPAPLSPSKPPSSPSWTNPTPTSTMAPRLPSPTFPSLEKAISSTSVDLAKSFEIDFDLPQTSPLTCDFSMFDPEASPSSHGSPRRTGANSEVRHVYL